MPIIIDARIKSSGVLPWLGKVQANVDRILERVGKTNGEFREMGTTARVAAVGVADLARRTERLNAVASRMASAKTNVLYDRLRKATNDINVATNRYNRSLASTQVLAGNASMAVQGLASAIRGMPSLPSGRVPKAASVSSPSANTTGSFSAKTLMGVPPTHFNPNKRISFRAVRPRGIGKPPDPFATDPLGGANYWRGGAMAGNPIAARHFLRYYNQVGRVQRAQGIAQHMGGPATSQSMALLQAVMRTRFGRMGGQVLGVDALRLLGSGNGAALQGLMGGGMGSAGAGASAAAPLLVAAAAVVALAAAAKMAKDAFDGWRQSLVSGGGSPKTAAQAALIGRVIGVDPTAVGSGLMNGYGPIAAAKAGINPFGGPFGDNDYNKKFLKLIDYIRRFPSTPQGFDSARRFAETAGSPGLANINLMSPDTYNRLRNHARGGSWKDMRTSADLQANLSMSGDSLTNIATRVGGPILQMVSKFLEGIDKVAQRVPWGLLFSNLRMMSEGLTWFFDKLIQIWDWVESKLPSKVKEAMGLDEQGRNKAVDKFGKHVENFGDYVNKAQGTFGGGPRAQSAVPSRLVPAMNPGYGGVPYGVL